MNQLEELESERRWDGLLAESADALGRLADGALADHFHRGSAAPTEPRELANPKEHCMSEDISKVRHIIEIDPSIAPYRGSSNNDVNAYLALDGWVLLSAGMKAGTSESGPYSHSLYILGWINQEEEPTFPAR